MEESEKKNVSEIMWGYTLKWNVKNVKHFIIFYFRRTHLYSALLHIYDIHGERGTKYIER